MTIKAILTDIEGTTSAVSFVFDVLFPMPPGTCRTSSANTPERPR